MAAHPGGGWRSSSGTARRALGTLLAGVAVLSAACGSAAPVAKAARPVAAGAARTTTTQVGAGPGAVTPGAPAGSPGGAASGGGLASSPGQGAPAGEAAGPSPARPGTYHYTQSGSFDAGVSSRSVPAQGTIVVDAPAPQSPDSWTQVWHSYLDTGQPPTDTTFEIAPSGIAVAGEVIRMAGMTFSCTFSPPVEVVAWPPAAGHKFAGAGQCGSFTAQVSGTVTGTQPASVDGAAVTGYVIETHVTTTGSVSSTSTETDVFDPGSRLDLSQDSQGSGSYEGIAFSSRVSRRIVSATPS